MENILVTEVMKMSLLCDLAKKGTVENFRKSIRNVVLAVDEIHLGENVWIVALKNRGNGHYQCGFCFVHVTFNDVKK